mgnify:CR=1 FL=1|jgi:hypothetical protein
MLPVAGVVFKNLESIRLCDFCDVSLPGAEYVARPNSMAVSIASRRLIIPQS